MKFALLGTDEVSLRLAAAAREMGHELVWVGDVRAEDAAAVGRIAPPSAERSDEWELLLDRSSADAVVIGRGTAAADLRAEQVKRLAAEAMAMLLVQPAFDSVLPYYEVDMTRREMGGLVRHYNPLVEHPAVAELAGWVAEGHPAIGTVHQLSCERSLAQGGRSNALGHLARDAELIAAAAGSIRRVTAIGPRPGDESFASLQTQMIASGPASVRWSVRSAGGAAIGLAMTWLGERGSVTLRANDPAEAVGDAAWELETSSHEGQDRRVLEPFDPAKAAIGQLAAAVAERDGERRAALSTWEQATRAMEVVDAVELSLEKGRTIDVHQQQLTERLAFRGTMAALGCGLILVGFLALVLITILGGAEGALGRRLLPAWPLALLAVLVLFLLLQVVPLMVRKSTRSASQATRLKADDGSR